VVRRASLDQPEMACRRGSALAKPRRLFRHDVGHGQHAEIVITERVYRVRINELS